MVFIDGQNLFHAAREAFGYTYPNYDVHALARRLCEARAWQFAQARFYTGIPDPADNAFWHRFWEGKLRTISWQGVHVYSRALRYRNKTVKLPDGKTHTFLAGEEKGIDVRIALDVIRMAHRNEYDIAAACHRVRAVLDTNVVEIERRPVLQPYEHMAIPSASC